MTVDFCAGLGDVIHVIYKTNRYELLENISAPVNILCGSHNPYLSELFRWHPKSEYFRIIESGHHYAQGFGKGLRGMELLAYVYERSGVSLESRVSEPKVANPSFYAPDEIASMGHVVIQIDASTKEKSIPQNIIKSILRKARTRPETFYIISRHYIRMKGDFVGMRIQKDLPQNVKHLTNLSIPATFNLVKSASMVIAPHSSLAQLAGFCGVPAMVLYPDGYIDFERPGEGYAWYTKLKQFKCLSFSEYESKGLFCW